MAVKTGRKPKRAAGGPPSWKGLTYEKFWAGLQESKVEFDKKLQESRADFDRRIQEISAIHQEITAIQKETDQIIKENAREQEKTEQQMKETAAQMKETDKRMGKLYNRFGELAEHLVGPGIEEKFNKLGFAFTRTQPNVRIKEIDNPDICAEVDVLLENSDVAIAVEIKSKPNQDDVDEHIERMEKLRIYADRRNDKRRYQGAIAGAIMSDAIRAYIIKKGFYLIEQTGDTVKINVPKGFKARDW